MANDKRPSWERGQAMPEEMFSIPSGTSLKRYLM